MAGVAGHATECARSPSLYGLTAGIIDQTQLSLLITVVVLSAIVPTAIAERWFIPAKDADAAPRGPRLLETASLTGLRHRYVVMSDVSGPTHGARMCVARGRAGVPGLPRDRGERVDARRA